MARQATTLEGPGKVMLVDVVAIFGTHEDREIVVAI
jgi:hypothetical protein